jgi:hypothetical protein
MLEEYDGNEALSIAKVYKAKIPLILTDIVIPQLNCSAAISETNPCQNK